ncbi:unnamed protein product [Dibothriocephalus latus]|uniref:Uncharacterized protein n=1 Tax=Dibothriocephalus latus TaxID=60516 RepID=A0A3P7NQL0_DIBLA|nr:unnamed protein product [Dibothriocephalus latus]
MRHTVHHCAVPSGLYSPPTNPLNAVTVRGSLQYSETGSGTSTPPREEHLKNEPNQQADLHSPVVGHLLTSNKNHEDVDSPERVSRLSRML